MRDEPAAAASDLDQDLERLRIVERGTERGPRRRIGRWIALVAVGLVAAGYFPAQRRAEVPTVNVVAVVRREQGLPPVALSAVGYLVPEREITVAASTQGKLVAMPVAENQRVRAGDLLARLENRDEQANLALARAERADAERQLQLTRELFSMGVRTRTELERAETAAERAEARIGLAAAALDKTELRAPFSGTIVRKFRDVGELLTLGVTAQGDPGTAIATLADLDPLHVALEINEAEIRKLRLQMVALVTPEAMPERRYLGDLIEIAARADRSKGVVAARVRIRDGDAELLPNMTVSVRFLSSPPSGEITMRTSIPRSALTRRDGRNVVFVVRGEKVQPVPVVVAAAEVAATRGAAYSAAAASAGTAGDVVSLLEGPGEGAYVVDSPPSTLRAGSLVRTAP